MSEGSRAVLEQESLQSKEDYINSFLDRLEGETLGRMLDYLSSELEQSATQVVLQKVPSEFHPKVRNHGEGPY